MFLALQVEGKRIKEIRHFFDGVHYLTSRYAAFADQMTIWVRMNGSIKKRQRSLLLVFGVIRKDRTTIKALLVRVWL